MQTVRISAVHQSWSTGALPWFLCSCRMSPYKVHSSLWLKSMYKTNTTQVYKPFILMAMLLWRLYRGLKILFNMPIFGSLISVNNKSLWNVDNLIFKYLPRLLRLSFQNKHTKMKWSCICEALYPILTSVHILHSSSASRTSRWHCDDVHTFPNYQESCINVSTHFTWLYCI